ATREGGAVIEALLALVTLTAMEVVLGIDNVIFIAIVAGRLPPESQPRARRVGLGVALLTRLGLLFTLFFLSHLAQVVGFDLTCLGVPAGWFGEEANRISVKNLVFILGGAFLIAKATMEIHHKLEGSEEEARQRAATASFGAIILQIAV